MASSLVFFAACQGGEGGTDGGTGGLTIDDGTLSGVVDGQAWTFVQGEGEPDGSGFVLLHLFATDYTPCDSLSMPGFEPKLLVRIPTTAPHDFGNGNFVTEGSNNKITGNGVLRVDEITATSVSAGLAMDFDADNHVSGVFTVTLCATP